MSPVACCLIGKTGKIFKFRNKKVTLPQKLKKAINFAYNRSYNKKSKQFTNS